MPKPKPKRNEYVDYLLELMTPLGGVSARAMFGGHGIYKDGMMFGLVADDTLYIKTDVENRPEFERLGLKPFVYVIKGKPTSLGYFNVPPEALESAAVMTEWARRGFGAALRAAARKAKVGR